MNDEANTQTEGTTNADLPVTETTTATPIFFIGAGADGVLKAHAAIDTFLVDFPGVTPITTLQGLIDDNTITLAAIVNAYNKMVGDKGKKVRGFKDRATGAKALVEGLEAMIASMNAAPATTADPLAASLKPKKAAKVASDKPKGEGRASPLSGKFWARSGTALSGRRLGGSGVGIKALQHIIDNPGVSTEDYIANSGGGRYVDLQYDLDRGNIVALTGATAEDRAKEVAELTEKRTVAEKAAAEAEAKLAADKKAKAEAAEKAKAEKKAKDEADKKAKAEAAAAEAAKVEAAKKADEAAKAK